MPVPVVDLPLGATEDRVVGALDLERALARGEKAFEPGLLARAHRGFLYIDEANLLEDHLVDLLLDVAASGENVVEREGLSIRHPARFVLVGTGNPEEGELRPQLLDRFGMSVEVKTPDDLPSRIEVVRRRDEFESDSAAFTATWAKEEAKLRKKIISARERLPSVSVSDTALERAAKLCMALGTDGLRGELTLMRAARALAALEAAKTVGDEHLRRVAPSALRHRLRRNPLDDAGSSVRVDRAIAEVFGMTAALAWSDAVTAAQLFAVDPVGTGGVLVRSRAGPVRERWLTMLRAALPIVPAAETSAAAYCRWTAARRPRPQRDPARRTACCRTRPAGGSRWRCAHGRDGGTAVVRRRQCISPPRWMHGRRSSSATGFRCGCRPGSA